MCAGALPFLVTHGWWVSKLVFLVSAGGLLWLTLLFRRALFAARARRQTRDLIDRETRIAEGDVLLRGVLRGHQLSSRRHPNADDGAVEVIDQRDGNWIEVDGTRVDLTGVLQVTRGSRVVAKWWGSTKVSLPENARYPHAGSRMDHTARDGDEVFVSGVASLRSIDGADERGRWVVSGAPVEVWALRHGSMVSALGPWLATLALVAAVAAYMGLRLIGNHLVDRAAIAEVAERMPTGISSTDGRVIASALPGSRERALDAIEGALILSIGSTERAVRQRVELAELQHGCAWAAYVLRRSELYEEALAKAVNCGAEEQQVGALIDLGRYEEAAMLATEANSSLVQREVLFIATKRWNAAAAILEAQAAWPEQAEDARRLQCIALLLRWYGGDRNAASRLETVGAGSAECQLAVALAADGDRRDAVIAAHRALPRGSSHRSASFSLAWMHGALADIVSYAVYGVVSPSGNTVEPWIASYARDRVDSRSARAWLVAYDVLRDDFTNAQADAREARRLADQSNPVEVDDATALDVAVRLRFDVPVEAEQTFSRHHLAVSDLLNVRRGEGVPSDLTLSDCPDDDAAAMSAAANGDGAPLAKLLETCRTYTSMMPWLVAVAPRLKSHRAELAKLVRFAFREPRSTHVFDLVQALSWRRDVARALGELRAAERFQAIINRHLDAFGTRDQMAAILLVDPRVGW